MILDQLTKFEDFYRRINKWFYFIIVLHSLYSDIQILAFTTFPATVVVEKHGMNGTICAEGWDNKDADVLCRQLGYTGGGVSFGPQYSGK